MICRNTSLLKNTNQLQDILHSTVHQLQAGGIFGKIVGPYDSEPLIPLPKVRNNEAMKAEQLIMLWLIWSGGITLAVLAFLFEFCSQVFKFEENATKRRQNETFVKNTTFEVKTMPTVDSEDYLYS